MANKKPLVFYNGIVGCLKDEDNILDKYSNSIAIRGESIAKKINSTQWRDEYVAGHWMLAGGQAAPDSVDYTIGGINIRSLSFDGSSVQERISNSFEISHDIDLINLNNEVYNLEFHVHFMPSSNNTGTVKWFFDYCYIPVNNSPLPQTTLELTKVISTNSQYKHLIVGTSVPKPSSDFNIGDIILFTLRRNPSDSGDTYSNDAILIKCALHIPIDTNGSSQMYIK